MRRNFTTKKLGAAVLALFLAFAAGCTSSSPSANTSTNPPPVSPSASATESTPASTSTPDDLVASFDTIHISMLGVESTNARKPVDDVLTPIWREKTKVIPDISIIPAGQDVTAWLQTQIIADTLPQVIATPTGIADQPAAVEMLKKAGMVRSITLEEMKKYMPRTAARLADLGVTMEEWYSSAADPTDGKLYVIPSLPYPLLKEEYRNVKSYSGQRLGFGGYGVWVRDDVLKQIYPNAMSSDELKAAALKNGGTLPLEQILDVPVKSIDQLHTFLKQINELGLKQDGQPMIPGHLQYNNTRGALNWSLFSITGLSLSYASPAVFVINEKTGTGTEYELLPEWKTYVSFMNQAYNEGLFGQDFFTQKDDQKDAKIISGKYAIINMWAPYTANIDQQKQNGGQKYGWRYLPIFANPANPDLLDASAQYFNLSTTWNSKLINAHNVTDAMMPQILNWLDWNYSTDAAIMRSWGSPDMTTGTGMDRRFKPEYQKVADYMLTGKQDATGDGWYYGMQSKFDGTMQNYEVYGLAGADEMGYVYSPDVVYPFSADNYDQYNMVNTAWQIESLKTLKLYARLPLSKEGLAAQAEYNTVSQNAQNIMNTYNDQLDNLMTKAISGSTADFEANYAAYLAVVNKQDMVDAQKAALDAYMKFYTYQQQARKALN